MLVAIIELQPNNIIIGHGSTFSTYINSNIIDHGHIMINNFNTLYTLSFNESSVNLSNCNRFRKFYHFCI